MRRACRECGEIPRTANGHLREYTLRGAHWACYQMPIQSAADSKQEDDLIEIIRNGDLWVVCDREAGRVYGRYRSFETAVRHKEIVQGGEERRRRALARNRELRAQMVGA